MAAGPAKVQLASLDDYEVLQSRLDLAMNQQLEVRGDACARHSSRIYASYSVHVPQERIASGLSAEKADVLKDRMEEMKARGHTCAHELDSLCRFYASHATSTPAGERARNAEVKHLSWRF